MNCTNRMEQYRLICKQILQQETLVNNLENQLDSAKTELNQLYQDQSEIFSEMEQAIQQYFYWVVKNG